MPLLKFKDPVSGFTHLAGAALGVFGLLYLLLYKAGASSPHQIVSFSIFCISAILLYLSSSLYHLLMVSEEKRLILRKIDHSMIFILIAGSYTPFCILALPKPLGWIFLFSVWTLAIGGLGVSIFWIHAPRWFSTALYILLGWLALIVIYPLYQSLTITGFNWLVAGGLFYTLGAVIYALKKPDPFPPHFGFHEIWHLFVLAGTLSHYFSITTLFPK